MMFPFLPLWRIDCPKIIVSIKTTYKTGAGEAADFTALAALAKEPDLVPSTHMATDNHQN